MNSTKVQNPRRYGGAHSAWRVQISGVHNTCEDCAPIIDGLGHAPPHPRAAGHLITVNNSIDSRQQYRSELVEDNDKDYAEDMQTDDLEDGEVYDEYDRWLWCLILHRSDHLCYIFFASVSIHINMPTNYVFATGGPWKCCTTCWHTAVPSIDTPASCQRMPQGVHENVVLPAGMQLVFHQSMTLTAVCHSVQCKQCV